MPPPAAQTEQNPIAQAQLRELNSALSQMAALGHAHNQHLRRTGEQAEKFGRSLDDARGNIHRELRDFLVAIHFTGESLSRMAKRGAGGGGGFGGAPGGRTFSPAHQRARFERQEELGRLRNVDWAAQHRFRQLEVEVKGQPASQRRPFQDMLDQERRQHARRMQTDARRAMTRHDRKTAGVPKFTPAPGGGAMAGLAVAGPALASFVAGLQLSTTAAKAWADVLTNMVQAASPNVWRTFTGSIQLVMARIGVTLLPTFIELAFAAQRLAEGLAKLDGVTKSYYGHLLTLRDPFKATGDTASNPKTRLEKLFGRDSSPEDRLSAVPLPSLMGEFFKNLGLRSFESHRRYRDGKEQPGLGLKGPEKLLLDLKTQEPRFSAVESVWEQMALGFLRDTDFDREMQKIAQESLNKLTEIAAAQTRRKPGA